MKRLLECLEAIAVAREGDDYDDIIKMTTPEEYDSRDEFESYFEDMLGYNPMNYFDKISIDEQIDEIIEKAPLSVSAQIKDKKEEIINRTVEYAKDVNDTVLHKILLEVIKDTVGWKPMEDDDISLDESIAMSIFGEAVDTDAFEDEEEEDYDDESLSDDVDDDDED